MPTGNVVTNADENEVRSVDYDIRPDRGRQKFVSITLYVLRISNTASLLVRQHVDESLLKNRTSSFECTVVYLTKNATLLFQCRHDSPSPFSTLLPVFRLSIRLHIRNDLPRSRYTRPWRVCHNCWSFGRTRLLQVFSWDW